MFLCKKRPAFALLIGNAMLLKDLLDSRLLIAQPASPNDLFVSRFGIALYPV